MNLQNRIEKLESEPVVVALLHKSTYSGECPVCATHAYAMAAVAQWERQRGLYVTPLPADSMMIECPHCGREYEEDGRGLTAEERELIRRYISSCDKGLAKEVDRIIVARCSKMWGIKIYYERCEVYYKAYKEFTGVDHPHRYGLPS